MSRALTLEQRCHVFCLCSSSNWRFLDKIPIETGNPAWVVWMNDSHIAAAYGCFCEWKHHPLATRKMTDHSGKAFSNTHPQCCGWISSMWLRSCLWVVNPSAFHTKKAHMNAVGQDHLANYRFDAVTAVKAIAILSFFGLHFRSIRSSDCMEGQTNMRDHWTGWWLASRGTHSHKPTHTRHGTVVTGRAAILETHASGYNTWCVSHRGSRCGSCGSE